MSSSTEEISMMRHRLLTSARISAMLDAPLPRLMARYWMVRLYIAASVITNCLIGFFEPQSLIAQVMRGSVPGWLCMALLLAMGLVALLDVIVNDLMPDEFKMPFARRHRHSGYSSIAVVTMGLTYIVLHEHGYTALVLAYWVDAAFALVVAYLDLMARHRGVA